MMKSLNLSRWYLGLILVVAVGVGAVIWFVSRGGKGNGQKPPAGEVSEIRIELPEGATGVNPTATVVKDLAELPKPASGASLVAAGKFEPAGATFPQGLKVTWPLSGKRDAASDLWIVTLNEKRKEWIGTGNKATVAEDGKSATGIVHHFSTIGLQDGPPAQKEGAGPVAGPGLRQVRPVRENEARQAEAAQARLAAIAWKASARLFDYRPTDELERLTIEAARVPLEAARQLRNNADRNAMVQLQVETAPEAAGPWLRFFQALGKSSDPLTGLKSSYSQIEFMLSEAKRTVSEGPLAQQLAAELKKANAEQEQAMTDSSPGGLQRFLDATDNRAKVAAKVKELERDKTSLEKSIKRFGQFKVAVELAEAAASDKPGSSFGLLKAVVSAVEEHNKDAFSQAPRVYQAKMFETEKALRAFNSAVAPGKSRGLIGDPRGYVVPGMVGQKKEALLLAEGKEFEAEGAFKHQARIKELLGNTKKVLSGVQKAYEAYDEAYKKFEALEKALDEVGPRLDIRSRHFAEYCTAVSRLIKSVVGNLESFVVLTPFGQAVVKMLLPMADVFEEMGKFVLTAQRLKDKFTQGIKQADDTPDGLMYPVEMFWVLKLTVYYIDDSTYTVPGPTPGPMVRLDAKKYQTFIRAVSSVTSLRGRNFTQTELCDLARDIAGGADKFVVEYQKWDRLGFSKIKNEFTLDQLTSDDGRATIDEEVGAMAQRYANISSTLTGDDVAVTRTIWFLDKFMSAFNRVRGTDEANLGEKSEIPLNKLLSIDDKENRDADRIYRKYNDTWERLESLWRDVYLSPLPSAIFGAVQQHEAKTARKEGDPSTYSPLEERLLKLRDGIRARPETPARILTLHADNPTWGEFRFNMVYATSGLTSKNVVSRYFKVKKGGGEWVEVNPSKAEDMPTGAAIEGFWKLPLSESLRMGTVTVQGIVEVDGKQIATAQHEINFESPFQFRFDLFPRKLQSEGKAAYALTAYVDERFQPDQMPELSVTLDGPGGESDTIKAAIDPKDVVWLNGHTMLVTGTIAKLPKWPATTKRTKASATLSFGNIKAAEQTYIEVTESDAGTPPPEPVVRQPVDSKPAGYQFKQVLRVDLSGPTGNAAIVFDLKDPNASVITSKEATLDKLPFTCELWPNGDPLPPQTPIHFTISSGSFTMHEWSFSGIEKSKAPPGIREKNRIVAGIGGWIPYHPQGRALTVTAEGPGIRATRTVKLDLPERLQKSVQKNLETAARGLHAEDIARKNQEIEAENKKIAQAEERKSKLGTSKEDNLKRHTEDSLIRQSRHKIRVIEQLELDLLKVMGAKYAARVQGDWDRVRTLNVEEKTAFTNRPYELELKALDEMEMEALKYSELIGLDTVSVPPTTHSERAPKIKADYAKRRMDVLDRQKKEVLPPSEKRTLELSAAFAELRGDWDLLLRAYPRGTGGMPRWRWLLIAGRANEAADDWEQDFKRSLASMPEANRERFRRDKLMQVKLEFAWWPPGREVR